MPFIRMNVKYEESIFTGEIEAATGRKSNHMRVTGYWRPNSVSRKMMRIRLRRYAVSGAGSHG